MNKTEFLQTLKIKLNKLPTEELDNIISYYTEYFEDAGQQNSDDKIIEQLGSSTKIANQIISEMAIQEMENEPTSIKKGLSSIWIILITILALPIGLPIAISLVAVIFALIAVLVALAFVFLILISVFGITGLLVFIVGLYLIFQDFATALFATGIGLTLFGTSLLVLIAFKWVLNKSFRSLALILNKFLKGRDRHE